MLYYKLQNDDKNCLCFSTTRENGVSEGNYASFNLSPYSGDDLKNWEINRDNLCEELKINSCQLIFPYQTHGTDIRIINEAFMKMSDAEKEKHLNSVDALITNQRDICIGVTTADCVPLIFFDSINEIAAVAHAGWRGTCARIAEKTIARMQDEFNCQAQNIEVIIGPSISASVYEVGSEVLEAFTKSGFDSDKIAIKSGNSFFLDLWKANRIQLENAGILNKNIQLADICTFTEHERFFSARRLGIKSGRILSGIIMKNVK